VIIAALVESLPLQEYDNLAVFASVAAMGHWLRW
jgi:hypothetical protein